MLQGDLGLAGAVAAASTRVASALTFLETDRALSRSLLTKSLPRARLADAARALVSLRGITRVALLSEEILERARQVFPVEPVRTLDAIHLATALVLRGALGPLTLLSLDRRVRENAAALGFEVFP